MPKFYSSDLRLKQCRSCMHKTMNPDRGIECGLTKSKPLFSEPKCPDFLLDPREKKYYDDVLKWEKRRLRKFMWNSFLLLGLSILMTISYLIPSKEIWMDVVPILIGVTALPMGVYYLIRWLWDAAYRAPLLHRMTVRGDDEEEEV